MPPVAPSLLNSATSNGSLSQEASGLAVAELQNLTPFDIEIIDAVITRAGQSTTTFFTVFKAYSEVLKEFGLDPQEVVYYGKLLKLGTLRGRNWGEKWALVKRQMNQPSPPTDVTSQTESEIMPIPHTRIRQEKNVRSNTRRQKPASSAHPRVPLDTKRRPSSHSLGRENALGSTPKADIFHPNEDFLSSTVVHSGKIKLPLSTTTSDEGELSPVPPSYKSAIVEQTIPAVSSKLQGGKADSLFSGKKIHTVPKERQKSPIDVDEAWKNIKMEQDEKFADEYRDSLLLTRCWEIWRQGYFWIITTHQQIQEARDKLLLRLFFQRWRNRLVVRRATEDRLVTQFSIRLVKRSYSAWKAKFKEKKHIAWREDMRQKMKIVKRKTDLRIKKDTWTKWQRLLLLQRAQKHYEIGLLYRTLTIWRANVAKIESMEFLSDTFSKEVDSRVVDRVWCQWKFKIILQHNYQEIARREKRRIAAVALDKWKARFRQVNLADAFHDEQILKWTLNQWKTAMDLKDNLRSRANKYLIRKDTLLLRVVVRIWRARMRGLKLQRFKELTTLQAAWKKWLYRLSKEGAQRDVAYNFLNRTDARELATAFQRWQQVLITHRNASGYAIKYDEAHLLSRMVLAWRMKFHDHLQMAKVARWANEYFVTRNAWRTWTGAVKKQKLREFEVRKLRKIFEVWSRRTKEVQYLKQCELVLQGHVEKRIVQTALTHWMNRVIEIKSRELDVAQQADSALLRAAFFKWQTCRRRHIEEVSLLENHLLVKREDILRRAFYRWLTVKRAAEHRRLTHQRKEKQLRQILITSAWDRWRERFKEEQLRPLEYELIIHHQRYVLQTAFKIWVAKTDALPAVRFYSRNLKVKFFRTWINALPNALKVKKATDTDMHYTLARFFKQWSHVYRTRITLKAVERAKYLRLPASSPRQLSNILRPRPVHAGTRLFPRQRRISLDEDNETEVMEDVAPARKIMLNRVPLSRPTYSERNAPLSEYAPSAGRQPSPVRSIVSLPDQHRPVKAASRTETAAKSDRLWDAIRRVGQGRR